MIDIFSQTRGAAKPYEALLFLLMNMNQAKLIFIISTDYKACFIGSIRTKEMRPRQNQLQLHRQRQLPVRRPNPIKIPRPGQFPKPAPKAFKQSFKSSF
jgi:hypothetical protein